MILNKKYDYPKSIRSLINDKRHYDVGNEKLPSVTTILSACQSDEKKESLARWKAKMGNDAADKVRDQAAERGTAMHKYLEAHIDGTGLKDLTPLGVQAETMAHKIIESGLRDLEEVWGQEVTLYYPGLYAGATDVVGIFDGQPAIIDFKQSNKPKRREWIEDYFLQLAGYAIARNQIYQTNIQFGIILMCSKDLLFQEFPVEGEEFRHYANEWWKKVAQYYKQKKEFQEVVDRSGM